MANRSSLPSSLLPPLPTSLRSLTSALNLLPLPPTFLKTFTSWSLTMVSNPFESTIGPASRPTSLGQLVKRQKPKPRQNLQLTPSHNLLPHLLPPLRVHSPFSIPISALNSPTLPFLNSHTKYLATSSVGTLPTRATLTGWIRDCATFSSFAITGSRSLRELRSSGAEGSSHRRLRQLDCEQRPAQRTQESCNRGHHPTRSPQS